MVSQLVSAAVVGALSPAAALVAILLLSSRRPVLNTLLCLAGWTLVLVLLAGLLYAIFHDHKSAAGHSAKAAVDLIVGLVLLGVALRSSIGGQHPIQPDPQAPQAPSPAVPSWMRRLERIKAYQALLLGMALIAASPADLAAYMSGVQALIGSDFSIVGELVTLLVLLVCIDSCIAVPLLVYVAMPSRAPRLLDSGRGWLLAHQRAVTSWSSGIFGVVFIVNSIASLA
jgi:hypothetical protein